MWETAEVISRRNLKPSCTNTVQPVLRCLGHFWDKEKVFLRQATS
jgi:hypothetical protein